MTRQPTPSPPPSRRCCGGTLGRCLLWLICLSTLGLHSAVQAATTLGGWRSKAMHLRALAENDVPLAYREAQVLQAGLPADATPADRARALNLLSRAEIYLALTSDAARHARSALALATEHSDKEGQAEAYLNLSLTSLFEADIKTLTTVTTQAMKVLDGVNRPDLLGEALLHTAMTYLRIGRMEESVTLCMQAMEIARRSGSPLALTYAHQGLAISFDQSGRHRDALEHFTQMQAQARLARFRQIEVDAALGIASTTSLLEHPRKAEPLLRDAIVQYRRIGNFNNVNRALFALAANLRMQGRHAETLPLLGEAIARLEQRPVKISLWWLLDARSANLHALGQTAAGRSDAERAYALAQEIGQPFYLRESSRRLAQFHAAQGDYQRAYRFSLESSNMAEKLDQQKSGERMVQLAERYQSESKQRQIDELTRRDQRSAQQQRWLWTLFGGSVAVLLLTAYFLMRLRRSQDCLQRQTDILQSILDSMGDGVTVIDARGELMLVNPAAEAILGLHHSRDHMTGWTSGHKLYLPDPASPVPQTELPLALAISDASSDAMDIFVHDPALPDGRWVSKIVRPIFGKNGAVQGGVAVFSDVTTHRRAAELLQKREREFRTLAEHSPDLIVRYDRDCRRIYVNPAYEQQTGTPMSQAQGTLDTSDVWQRCINFSRHDYQAFLLQVQRSGMPAEISVEWRRSDGRIVTHAIRAVPEHGQDGEVTGVLAIGRDISARKEAERRLAESYGTLRELSARRDTAREEERARIARELHDELGQLLTALRLGISTLRMQFGASHPALADRVHALTELADKTLQGVRDAATLLRPPALDMGIVAALEWLAAEFSRHTGIACEFSASPRAIHLDEKRSTVLFRLVQESLTNVARHAEARSVKVSLISDDDGYRLEVRDDGKGFEPASSSRRSFGLMGMRERSTILGGEVTIDSAPGRGTAIQVHIPVDTQTLLEEAP